MEAKLEIISTCQMSSFSFKVDTDMWPVWHFHPEYDILLILKNTGHYLNGDYIGDLKPGTLVIVGPNIPHAFHPAEVDDNDPQKPSTMVLQFSTVSLGREFLQKPEMAHIAHFLEEASRSFEFFGETRRRSEEIILGMSESSEIKRFTELILLLDLLANSPAEERQQLVSPLYSPSLNKESVSKIDLVSRYIVNNLNKRITLNDAAELSLMSPKSFSRFFKKNTGKNFVQYVNEMRIAKACRQLIETNDSISTICYEAGFNALSNFNRRFQEVKNMTPREFRVKYREKKN